MNRMDRVLRLVCKSLDKCKIEYVLIGGIAVGVHGVPRTTMDVDIIVRPDKDKLAALVSCLKETGFLVDLDDALSALKERSHFSAQDCVSILRLDIKGVYSKMDEKTIERRMTIRHHGVKMFVETPEDLIAAKLVFGSEQDVRDAEGVYIRQKKKLDLAYLEEACKANGVLKGYRAMLKRLKEIA